jgi:hypothetical protein
MVPCRTFTFIVIDQVMTRPWLACTHWTIRNVATDANLVPAGILLLNLIKTTVTLTVKVVPIIARRVIVVNALAMSPTLVRTRSTVVEIQAARMSGKGPICLALGFQINWTVRNSIYGVSWLTLEDTILPVDKLRTLPCSPIVHLLGILGDYHCATLDRSTTTMLFVLSIGLTSRFKYCWSVGLTIF